MVSYFTNETECKNIIILRCNLNNVSTKKIPQLNGLCFAVLSFIKSNYLKPLNFVEVKIYSPQNSEVQKTRYINYSHNKFILFFFIKFVQKCDVSNKIM